MKLTLATQVGCAALVLSAVFSLVAWVATRSEAPPVTAPAAPAPRLGARTLAAHVTLAGAPEQLAPSVPLVPRTLAPDPRNAEDVARLRARGLTLPLATVSAAQLVDTYHQARAGTATHEALDIMAPRGTPVLAVEDGRIVKLFVSQRGGITLYQVDPGNEYVYYYAHLDRYAEGVTEGDRVRKGQLIGYVGSTGNALPDAPHLHFAVLRLGPERQWWRGTPINPFLLWRGSKP